MLEFNRTPEGQSVYHNFVRSPIVWVEGSDDIVFYEYALGIKGAMILHAGGKLACERLAKETVENSLPQIVIMDGDYDVIERKRNPHRRIIYLARYAIENYLLEKSVVNEVCCALTHAQKSQVDRVPELTRLLKELEKHLAKLVETDIGHRRIESGIAVMPPSGSLFSECKVKLASVKQIEVAKCIEKYHGRIPREVVVEIQKKMCSYMLGRRFVDIFPGHYTFQLLRTIVASAVKRCGGKMHCDNGMLMAILCKSTWYELPTQEHKNLRRKLRAAYHDAERLVS